MWNEKRLRRVLAPALHPGERLLWCGKPDSKEVAARRLPAVGIGLVWATLAAPFVVLWENWARQHQGGLVEALGSVPGLLTGLFVLSLLASWLAPVVSYLLAWRTVYGVTDQRIIILWSFLVRLARSYDRSDRACVAACYAGPGKGDLIFGRRQVHTPLEGLRLEGAVRLYGVPGVYGVRRLLRMGDPRYVGRGTEPEAATAPAGRGSELQAAPPPEGRGNELEATLFNPTPDWTGQGLEGVGQSLPLEMIHPEFHTTME